MARNSAGTYSLPPGINPVTPFTVILASWANTTLDDVATAMTDSLDRQGRGGMQAPLKIQDGSLALPGLAFNSEATLGIYRSAAGVMNFVVSGASKGTVSAAGWTGLTLVSPTLTGTIALTGTLTITGDISLTGTLAIGTDLIVGGNTTLGNATTDTLNVGGGGIIKSSNGRTIVTANSEIYALSVRYSSSTGSYFIGASNSATPDLLFNNNAGATMATLTNVGAFSASGEVVGTYLRARSGAAGTATWVSMGRTAEEYTLGVVGVANQFFSGTVPGSAVLAYGTKLYIGTGDADTPGALQGVWDGSGNLGVGADPSAIPGVGSAIIGTRNVVLFAAGDTALTLVTDNAATRTQQIGFGSQGIAVFDAGFKYDNSTRGLNLWVTGSQRINYGTVQQLMNNAYALSWKNSGGTARIVLQMYSDNNVYLDSIDAGIIFRTGVGPATRVTITDTYLGSTVQNLTAVGSAGAPAYSFSTATNYGMWLNGTSLAFSVGGTTRVSFSSSIATSTIVFQGPTGANTAPTYSFSSATNYGMYLNGGNVEFAVSSSVKLSLGTNVQAAGTAHFITDNQLFVRGATATPAGGGAAAVSMGSVGVGIYWGSGLPSITAPQGSLYLRTDGSSTGTRMYINTNGSNGWTNVTTAA